MTGNEPFPRRVSLARQPPRRETGDAAVTLNQVLDDAGLGDIRPVLDDEKGVPSIRLHSIDAEAATRLGHLVRKGTEGNYLLVDELRPAVRAHDLDDFPLPEVCGAKIALGEVSIRMANRLACILGAPPGPELDETPDWPESKEVYDRLDAALRASDVGVFVGMWLHSYCRRCEGDPAIELGSITVDVARRLLKALQSAACP